MAITHDTFTSTPRTLSVIPDEARPRISWSAVFAGVVLVLAIQLLLSVLGAGIGFGILHPDLAAQTDTRSVATGAGVWWLVSTVIAFVFGSYAAARLAGVPTHFDGLLHGLVIWGLALILTFFLLTSAVGGLIGGAFSVFGGAISTASEGIAKSASGAQGVDMEDMVQRQVQTLLQPMSQDPASMSPEDAAGAITAALPDVVAGGTNAGPARDRIIAIIAAQQGIGIDQATDQFQQAQENFMRQRDQAVAQARAAAVETAKRTSQASYLAFAALLIGALSAGFGGALASPRATVIVEDDPALLA